MPEYEVSVSCKDLADKDLFSKSDPVLILLENVPNSKRFVELGKTEVIKDCLSPQFAKKFRLSVQPERDSVLRVAVVDIDNFEDIDNIGNQEFIGRADFRLSQLVSGPVFTASLGKSDGLVVLKASPYQASLDGRVAIELSAGGDFDLVKKKRPLFLELHCADEAAATLADAGRVCPAAYTLAHRTEQSQTGAFQPIAASLFSLCRGDWSRLLRLECWRRGSKGDHVLVGSRHTSLAELHSLAAEAGGGGSIDLADKKGRRPHRLAVLKVSVQPLQQ